MRGMRSIPWRAWHERPLMSLPRRPSSNMAAPSHHLNPLQAQRSNCPFQQGGLKRWDDPGTWGGRLPSVSGGSSCAGHEWRRWAWVGMTWGQVDLARAAARRIWLVQVVRSQRSTSLTPRMPPYLRPSFSALPANPPAPLHSPLLACSTTLLHLPPFPIPMPPVRSPLPSSPCPQTPKSCWAPACSSPAPPISRS